MKEIILQKIKYNQTELTACSSIIQDLKKETAPDTQDRIKFVEGKRIFHMNCLYALNDVLKEWDLFQEKLQILEK